MTLATSLLRGRFIVLEGVDGSGKTTQLQALASWLLVSGLMPLEAQLITTRAPGGTVLGQALRGQLLHPPGGAEPYPITELMLYAADISQLTAQIIEPALAAGNWVLCDRFTGSTMAYQGYGRGLDLALIKQLNQMATSGLEPDLTLWLDLPLTDSLRRRGHRLADRMEAVSGTFLGQVIQGYRQLWSANGWSAIDASQGIEAVTVACQMALQDRRFTLGRSKIHPRRMVALPVRAALERLVELQDDTRPTSAIVGDWADAIAAARAALAEPVGEGPTDEDLRDLWSWSAGQDQGPWPTQYHCFARAILARFGGQR